MVLEINPDAWTIAKELDEERACGKLRGFVVFRGILELPLIEIALSMASRFLLRITSQLLLPKVKGKSYKGDSSHTYILFWVGMNTTAGSFSLLGSVVPGDAGVVERLRKAGAIILGEHHDIKTIVSDVLTLYLVLRIIDCFPLDSLPGCMGCLRGW